MQAIFYEWYEHKHRPFKDMLPCDILFLYDFSQLFVIKTNQVINYMPQDFFRN